MDRESLPAIPETSCRGVMRVKSASSWQVHGARGDKEGEGEG